MSERKEELEWTPEESEELAALPRERQPDWRLEESTVARLKEEGLLSKPRHPWWRLPWAAWGTAVAAALIAVFFLGYSLGQRAGSESAAEMMAAMRAQDLEEALAQVQQTGSAYVTALAALGRIAAEEGGSGHSPQTREVAVAALYAAAEELIRLNPNDPVATRLLIGLEAEGASRGGPDEQKASKRLFWF